MTAEQAMDCMCECLRLAALTDDPQIRKQLTQQASLDGRRDACSPCYAGTGLAVPLRRRACSLGLTHEARFAPGRPPIHRDWASLIDLEPRHIRGSFCGGSSQKKAPSLSQGPASQSAICHPPGG